MGSSNKLGQEAWPRMAKMPPGQQNGLIDLWVENKTA